MKTVYTPDSTSTVLVEHLELKEQTDKRDALISRCKALEFDDFQSPHAAPKILLVDALQELEYYDLAARVRRGVYDAE